MSITIGDIINSTSGWYTGGGHKNNIVISTRVRIARNLENYSFPHWCSERDLRSIEDFILTSLSKSNYFKDIEIFDLLEIEENDAAILMERNLISAEFIGNRGKILILGKNIPFSIILNEEDHIRMQIFASGLELKKVWELLNNIDDEFEEIFTCAYHKKYGYLTSCTTNCGTGLRASIMVHLPALVFTKKVSTALKAAGQVGLVVRGFHGENTESLGNIYQISNKMCLGLTEEEIIENLCGIGSSLIDYEEKSREIIYEQSKHEIEDMIWRSYGILKNCRMITTKESFELLSNLRLGVDLGLISNIGINKINELYFKIQHAHIKKNLDTNSDIERLGKRADIIREYLKYS